MALRRIAVTLARGCPAWTPQNTTTDAGTSTQTFNGPYDDLGATKDLAWTGPLPDLVLAPLSTVRLMVGYSAGPNVAVVVGPTVVTLSSQDVASTVAVAQPTPLFVPIPVTELNPSP